MIEVGREVCSQLPVAESREWLVTNGIGGFAMGTVAGLLTRRYHGLLFAALQPPLGRTLLLAKLDENCKYGGADFSLFANRWADATVEQEGLRYLERFHLEGTTPVWSYAYADALLEKRIWMEPGANTTYIHYTLQRGSEPFDLYAKALVNYRDYHQTTIVNDWQPDIRPVANGLRIKVHDSAQPLYLLSDRGQAWPDNTWYEDIFLSVEEYRGQTTSSKITSTPAISASPCNPANPSRLLPARNPTRCLTAAPPTTSGAATSGADRPRRNGSDSASGPAGPCCRPICGPAQRAAGS
jgi:predicted glycogen debranching enzyme